LSQKLKQVTQFSASPTLSPHLGPNETSQDTTQQGYVRVALEGEGAPLGPLLKGQQGDSGGGHDHAPGGGALHRGQENPVPPPGRARPPQPLPAPRAVSHALRPAPPPTGRAGSSPSPRPALRPELWGRRGGERGLGGGRAGGGRLEERSQGPTLGTHKESDSLAHP
jgi:hypothetical protein